MDRDKEEILGDIDRLRLAYQVKLYSAARMDWLPYFHELSLDSYQNNQLFLDSHQLFPDYQYSVLLSGLALSKEDRVKEINLVGNNCCFTANLSCPSPVLGEKLPDLKNSANARWKCKLNLSVDREKQNFDLIIVLDGDRKITYKKLEFRLMKLSKKIAEDDCKLSKHLVEKIESIGNSRRLMASNISQNKNYLFAIGNARSGTTSLGQLLNTSPEICLGIERYSNSDNISALSFIKESFFDSKSKNYLVRPHLYEKIRDKFETAKYIGDKRPRFIKSWQNTWLNLPQAKIIYIFRNIYDVAYSYNTRANDAALGIDKEWSTRRDFSQAVKDWNEGLQEINKMVHFYDVYLIKYEDFFVDRLKMLSLFDYLKVDPQETNTQAGMDRIHKNALSLCNKPRILADSEQEYINANADFESYNYLLSLYKKQFNLKTNDK